MGKGGNEMAVVKEFSQVGDVTVARIKHSLDSMAQVDAILAEYNARRSYSHRPKLLLDMRAVGKISPTALVQLEAIMKNCEWRGGQLQLLKVDQIRDLGTLTQLGFKFEIHSDEFTGVRSFL
jgi:anti-anti-sigma regulatory factor